MIREILLGVIAVLTSGYSQKVPMVIGGYGDHVNYPSYISVNGDLVSVSETETQVLDMTDPTDFVSFALDRNVDTFASIFISGFDVAYNNYTYYVENLYISKCTLNNGNFGGSRGCPYYTWFGQYSQIRCYGEVWSMPLASYNSTWSFSGSVFSQGQSDWGYNYASYSCSDANVYIKFPCNQFSAWADWYVGSYLYAFNAGWQVGYDYGYSVGSTDGNRTGYQSGYNAGYSAGESLGYSRGYNEGYTAGYDAGVEYAEGNSPSVIGALFGAVVNVPISVLNGLVPLAIWDVPIISIIVTLLLIGLIIWIIKAFLVAV